MNTICQGNCVADDLKLKGCYTKTSNTSMLQNF
uniref:Pco128311 n=1 Tax=Arundo donax TaxID=35708 RepID=A0A0A9E928_ARUDO